MRIPQIATVRIIYVRIKRMKIILKENLLLFCIFLVGCGTVKPVIYEGNNQENYKNIFSEQLPLDIEVVNSVYVTYSGFNIGVVTTPDWEIELIVPKSWIDGKMKKMSLRKADDKNNIGISSIKDRIKNRGREWYVPKDISKYDCYYLYLTSIPYVHMLVDKTPIGKDQFKVFLSKH